MRFSLLRPVEKREERSYFFSVPPEKWVAWWSAANGYPHAHCAADNPKDAVEGLKQSIIQQVQDSSVDLWRPNGAPEEYGVEEKLDQL